MTLPLVSTVLLDVQSLQVEFPSQGPPLRAVDGVSFTVANGETVCLVGESGCGKSLTALALLRLVPEPGRIGPSSRLHFEGVDVLALASEPLRQLRGRRMAMIFQEPMTALNPVRTVGDQIAEVVRAHTQRSKREAWQDAVKMLALVGIADPDARARQYPHELSGGMRQRVMIAMALVLDPQLLIADEPTTALDVTIQAQILELLREMRERTGMALLLITHDLGVVAEMASRVLVMYGGRIVEEAPVDALFAHAAHPYSQGLLAAMPRLHVSSGSTADAEVDVDTVDEPERLATIGGSVPALGSFPTGCAFRDRCPLAWERCAKEEPPLYQVGPAHRARCHLVQERPSENLKLTGAGDQA
ncbi:MAG: ABC transporter ATP-binding protein [Gemmatimonadaceae bacterium]|nr:ABC transporter ATP-binding protein [Gemmatimonadaceae bacterium]